jgi:hypothetical protein
MTPTAPTTIPEPTAALVPRPESPLPIFGGPEMRRAYAAYRELQKALDDSLPDQIMTLGDKPFRKKGYWRAVAVAFNLDVHCLREARVAHDGDWGWEIVYRAEIPRGRSADGDGSCFASEKSRGRMTASEHNVRSHAHTRAYNRAVANLVGFGEVSAEEVERDERPPASESRPSTARTITKPQQQRMFAIAKGAGWTDDQIRGYLFERFGIRKTDAIRADDYDSVCEVFASPPPTDAPAAAPSSADHDPPLPAGTTLVVNVTKARGGKAWSVLLKTGELVETSNGLLAAKAERFYSHRKPAHATVKDGILLDLIDPTESPF